MFTTDLFEQSSRPVTVCFGRMNPPTLGHGQLLKTVSDSAGNEDYYIFATKTHKLPDNPLPYDVKFKFLQAMFPEYAEHMVYDTGLKTIMQVAQWLYDKGYTELNFVAGSDRIPEFSKLLNTYNGKGQPGDKGYYIFSKINMISAGDRDPDAEGLAGISASKARAAAEAGNFEDFMAKTGAGDLAKPLYDAVRKAQGVSEDIAPASQDTTSPIHGKPVEEEAAGVGVVAASSKMAKDPRYSMSITKDVKPSTPKNMLRAFKLSEGPVSAIAKTIAGLTGAGTVLGVKQSQQRQQDKKEQEQLRQERIKKLDDPQAQKDFDNWFKQYEQERLNKIQSASEPLNEKWSQKQRKSVDCSNPKGFSQKAHCAGRKARQAGRKTKSGPVSESKQTELSVIPMIKKFLPIVKEELKLEKLPKIKVQRHIEVHNGQATFGRFVNDEQVIYVGIADRHPVDVLRTLAHELVHWKQFVEGRIEPDSGKTGSPIENEAHAVAGILMRQFNKKYPDAIKLNNIELQESQDYVLGNVGYSSALNPVAWENEELKPEVRDRLLKISGEFVKYLEVPGFDVLDVVLTGSMANYNWTEYSDFDLHVVTNYSDLECEDLAETFYRAKKELWNNNHDITIGGHEVEMYVEDTEKPPVSAGVYSILDNRWIKKPVYDKPEIDKSAVNAKVRDMLQQIKSAIASADSPTDIQRIKDKLRKMRRAGLDSAGEFSVENLTYKILRNMGILNKMSDIQTREQDQQLSLPESKKKINSATVQLNEKKRRKKRKIRAKGGPYYGYYYGLGTASDSGVEGGDGGGVEEGELIPWPKGTVKVDVSDVYDWYKLGQHISNLKGLGKHDFGKGPPQTVMAFGSEPLEHEYIKDLNKIGLKTYDIDENLAEGNNIKILLKVNDQDSTVDVTAMLDGQEVGHVNFDDSEGELIPQDLYVDTEYRGQGIAAAMYDYTKSKGYTILQGEEQSDDAVGFWAKHRPGKKVWEQGFAEGKMAELDMDLEDPEITDRQFEKMYGMTRKEARELFSKTNMWDFPDFRDPDKPIHEQDVSESLDSPYSYHWEEGDFGDLNAYAQLSDNTVLDIEFEQINVDKSQWTVGFQRDGQIHKTGKGDEQRVFATVLSAIKEFIENKQPKEVFFSAEKSEVNPESRKRLYDRLVQKYATALGYQAAQSETNWGTKYKFSRIRERGVAEGKVKLYTDPNYFGAEVDDAGFDSLPVINIPLKNLIGFEPDKKMQEPKAKANVKKILAGLATGDNIPAILVRKYKDDYQVLDGHHRFWAYKVAKKDTIPAKVVDPKDIVEISKQGVAEDTANLPSVLYHATYKPRLKSIKLKGLGAGGKRNWEDSKRGIVYLSLDPNVAESYAETSDMVPEEWLDEIVILKISTAGLDPNKFHIDSNVQDNAGDTVEYHGVIPVSNISMYKQGVAEENLKEFAPGPDFRDDDDRQDMPLLEFAKIIKLFLGSEYTMIDRKTPEQVSVKFDPKDRTSGHNGAVLYSIIGKKQNEYPTVNFQLIDYEQGPQVGRGRRAGTAIPKTRTNALKIADMIYNTMGLPQQDRRVEENFPDGKHTAGNYRLQEAGPLKIAGQVAAAHSSANDVVSRFQRGDYAGAGIGTLSAIANLKPGLGTAVSLGLDYINDQRDKQNSVANLNKPEVQSGTANDEIKPINPDAAMQENFADGRNPGRKGLAKRMGVPTKASVSRLRQIAKSSSGEKQRMAHWMANMKAGKKK